MKLFHNSTLNNRALNRISKIKNEIGIMEEDPSKIVEVLVNFYKNTMNNFNCSNWNAQEKILEAIPELLMPEDNVILNKQFTLDEIKKSLFNLTLDKSPGPDGFQAFFFQKCWDIMGIEIWKEIEASRNAGSILSKINHTFLTLIPKKMKSENPGDYRPIALCNALYKILSKELANQLKYILPKLISEEQTSFVPGRSILDGLSIIQEVIHFASKNQDACMLMKLDIHKAYDMID